MLLRQDVLVHILSNRLVKSGDGKLFGINTIFGWVIGGYCDVPSQAAVTHICCKAFLSSDTDSLLRAFWEIEEPPSHTFLSSEDS